MPTFFKALLTSALVVSSLGSIAQTKFEWKSANSSGFTYKYVSNDPMKARFYQLKNGLTVILSENHKEPRIQALIPTRAGSNTDPKDHTGLAHYLEHMLFKGTDKYGSLDWSKEKPLLDKIDALYEQYNKTTDAAKRKEIYKEIDKTSGEAAKYAIANEYDKMMAAMGGQGTNAFTSYEQTVYTEDIPTNAIDRFLALQAERFRNPILRIFHTELEAVYEEKNRSLDNDPWKVEEIKYAALFPTHNYGQQTTIGTIEHLKNPSLIEIRNYFKKYYVPNNMAIIMVGDFNSDELIKKIDKAFAYMQPKPVQEYKPAPEAPITAPIVKEVFGPTPDNITIAWRWPGAVSPKEHIIGTIVDELMSNSKAGLIDINLSKAQKVLRAGSNPDWNKDYSVWTLSGTPKNGQSLEEVRDLLLGQLDLLKKGQFDESIIKAIAANYKLNAIQGLEKNDARAYKLLNDFVVSKGADWNETSAMTDALSKVTKQQVIDFANKYCGNGYVIVYKRKGEDKNIIKVDKPEITQVETNREKQSEFLKSVNGMPMKEIQPKWLDYNKDLQKGKVGPAEVLYVKNEDNDLFRLTYRFDMGSWNSKVLPIALQYLNFLGTPTMSAEEISKEYYKLASNFGANFTDHHINLSLSGLNENFDRTVSIFEQLITQAKADPATFELLKGRLIKQRNDAKANKGAILQGLAQYAQFGAKNPRTALNFTNDELKALTVDEVVNFLKDLFNFKHTVIYYGPKSLEQFSADISKVHKFPAHFKADLPLVANFDRITPSKTQVLFTNFDMVQAEIDWIRPTVKFDPAQTPVVELFNNYFGGGMSSIVFQTIRESKALAYSTYAYYFTPNTKDEKYYLVGYVGTQADKLNEAIPSMNELFNVFPASEKNLETAKESMLKNYQTERITQDAIAFNYLAAQEKGLNYDERSKIFEALRKLGLEDLKKFQEANIANKPVTYCIVGSDTKIKVDELSKYGEVKKLTLEEVFGY
ncbi:pitrilysin family protein [Flectobacillus sp. BAB-3569]|uniref:M16 family metallopeptidase n=1 Tax=Flectobacillus sp. BAB-3569 TaxID=1509483 RepID=UPI000BA4C8AD|nr:insulinase family protein [Flectobacillus sp. BAB-3569]PAC29352.1 peptidase M16 [Flectobacillus sp. BAB-3569]